MSKLDELAKLADAAGKENTQGTDWLLDDEGWVWASDYWGYQSFIAAANPQTIKQLIALCRMQNAAMKRDVEGQLDEGIEVLDCVKEALAAFDKFNGG